MRKYIFLLSAIIATSCSQSNDSGSSTISSYINPPTWIQGTWIQAGGSGGYKFTTNDFILIGSGSSQTSFSNAVNQTNASGGNATVHEIITSNSYNIDITIGVHTDSYYFNKITNTKIEWVNDPLGSLADIFYIKQ